MIRQQDIDNIKHTLSYIVLEEGLDMYEAIQQRADFKIIPIGEFYWHNIRTFGLEGCISDVKSLRYKVTSGSWIEYKQVGDTWFVDIVDIVDNIV